MLSLQFWSDRIDKLMKVGTEKQSNDLAAPDSVDCFLLSFGVCILIILNYIVMIWLVFPSFFLLFDIFDCCRRGLRCEETKTNDVCVVFEHLGDVHTRSLDAIIPVVQDMTSFSLHRLAVTVTTLFTKWTFLITLWCAVVQFVFAVLVEALKRSYLFLCTLVSKRKTH